MDALYNLIAKPDKKLEPIVIVAPTEVFTKDNVDQAKTFDEQLAELKEKS